MEGVNIVTKETRILFGLVDIKNIRIKCGKLTCGEEILFSTTGTSIPETCPHCNDPWTDGRQRLPELNFVKLVRDGIESQKSSKIRIRLEIEEENDSETQEEV